MNKARAVIATSTATNAIAVHLEKAVMNFHEMGLDNLQPFMPLIQDAFNVLHAVSDDAVTLERSTSSHEFVKLLQNLRGTTQELQSYSRNEANRSKLLRSTDEWDPDTKTIEHWRCRLKEPVYAFDTNKLPTELLAGFQQAIDRLRATEKVEGKQVTKAPDEL